MLCFTGRLDGFRYVPLWVTMAMSYLLIVVGVVCSHKLSTILAQLSPAKMDDATMFELAPVPPPPPLFPHTHTPPPPPPPPPYRLSSLPGTHGSAR